LDIMMIFVRAMFTSIFLVYLLTAVGLTPGGSSTVHIYTQAIHKQQNETEYLEWNIHNNKNS